MEVLAVGVAAFFQLMGCYFFFAQPKDRCSSAPDLASWLFLGATLCYLWDANIYPRRFMHMPRYWKLIIEIVAAIFLTELGTIIIWCGLERFLFGLTNDLLNLGYTECNPSPYAYGYWLSGVVTSLVSGAVLWYVLKATDGTYYFIKFTENLRAIVHDYWQMFRCYKTMNSRGRRRALRVCQLARKTPCRRPKTRMCCPQEDDESD